MNSFFRNALPRSKDSLIKDSLQAQLASCIKDIQLDQAHSGQFVSGSEAAEALCIILEAIFIHGVKESITDRFVIAMGDPDIRPQPNFWPALLVFSHRELIDQVIICFIYQIHPQSKQTVFQLDLYLNQQNF